MKQKRGHSNSYTVAGARITAAALKPLVEAARVGAVAAGCERRSQFAAAQKPGVEAPVRKHRKTTAAERETRKCERRQAAADLQAEMDHARMRTAANRRQRSEDRAGRQLEREAAKSICTMRVRRRFKEAPAPYFKRHAHSSEVRASIANLLPGVDDDGFANLTLKVWNASRDCDGGVKLDEFAGKALYITDPAGLSGCPADAILTNMIRSDRDGHTLEPGSQEFNDELVALCRAISEFERDAERTTKDGQHAQQFVHLMFALPAALSAEQRHEIMADIVERFADAGLPFIAALHRPSRRGDQRNEHFHVVVSKRPFTHIGPRTWQFAPTKNHQILDPLGLRILRAHAVDVYNRGLQEVGIETRFTALTREERGLNARGKRVGSQPGEGAALQAVAPSHHRKLADLAAVDADSGVLLATVEHFASACSRLTAARNRGFAERTAKRAQTSSQLSDLAKLRTELATASSAARLKAISAHRVRWQQAAKAKLTLLYAPTTGGVVTRHVHALHRRVTTITRIAEQFDRGPRLHAIVSDKLEMVRRNLAELYAHREAASAASRRLNDALANSRAERDQHRSDAQAHIAHLGELPGQVVAASTAFRAQGAGALRAIWRQAASAKLKLMDTSSPYGVMKSHVATLERRLVHLQAAQATFESLPRSSDVVAEHARAVDQRLQALNFLQSRLDRAKASQLSNEDRHQAERLSSPPTPTKTALPEEMIAVERIDTSRYSGTAASAMAAAQASKTGVFAALKGLVRRTLKADVHSAQVANIDRRDPSVETSSTNALLVESIVPSAPQTPSALTLALEIAFEPKFAELKQASATFARALDDGKITLVAANTGGIELSVANFEAARALWLITQTSVGQDYLQRVKDALPAAVSPSVQRGHLVTVRDGIPTFHDPHLNGLLPVLFARWRETSPELRHHAIVVIDAVAGYPHGASLEVDARSFWVRAPDGSAPLLAAHTMLRSKVGRHLLYNLAQASPPVTHAVMHRWKIVDHPRLDPPKRSLEAQEANAHPVAVARFVLSSEQMKVAQEFATQGPVAGRAAFVRIVSAMTRGEIALRIEPDGGTITGCMIDASRRVDLDELALIPDCLAQLRQLALMDTASGSDSSPGWYRWRSADVRKSVQDERTTPAPGPLLHDRGLDR